MCISYGEGGAVGGLLAGWHRLKHLSRGAALCCGGVQLEPREDTSGSRSSS